MRARKIDVNYSIMRVMGIKRRRYTERGRKEVDAYVRSTKIANGSLLL